MRLEGHGSLLRRSCQRPGERQRGLVLSRAQGGGCKHTGARGLLEGRAGVVKQLQPWKQGRVVIADLVLFQWQLI